MSNLDMSLDDIIKMNKKSGGRSNARGRGRSSGLGPDRRSFKRTANSKTPYSAPKVQAPETTWDHDMFAEHSAAYPTRVNQISAIETGTKLFISNLEYGVSNEDIKELFSEVGDLKRYSVHYDRSGRSKGTAEVVFARKKDAEAAVKRYDNVQLDGKPMKIEIVGTNIASAAAVPSATVGMHANENGAARSEQVSSVGRPQGGARGLQRGRGRGRGRGRVQGGGRGEKMSSEDLDADLEKYHAEGMQTN